MFFAVAMWKSFEHKGSSPLTSSPSIDVNQISEQGFVATLSSVNKAIYSKAPTVIKSAMFNQWKRNNPLSVEQAMATAAKNIAAQAIATSTEISNKLATDAAVNASRQVIDDYAKSLSNADKSILYGLKDAARDALVNVLSDRNNATAPLDVLTTKANEAIDNTLQITKANPAQQKVLTFLKTTLLNTIPMIPKQMNVKQQSIAAAASIAAPITMANWDASAVYTINPIVNVLDGGEVIVDLTNTRNQAIAKINAVASAAVASKKLESKNAATAVNNDITKLNMLLNDFVNAKQANLRAAAIAINLKSV
jgi:hypothetical protein